jgi:exodeoxyribonuclease V alpha subunit
MINNILTYLYNNDLLTFIDVHFAGFMTEMAHDSDPDLALAAALASNATILKHVCLDLESLSEKILLKGSGSSRVIRCPSVLTWRRKLTASPVVGDPGDERPLILDHKNRLYLYRYWEYERLLAKQILEKVNAPEFKVEPDRLLDCLDRFFPGSKAMDLRSYRSAMITSCFKRFCVITGGPGTGKTSTAAKVLAALLEQPGNETLRIALAAPTGKSAIRLGESIRMIKTNLDCPSWVKDAIPSEPQTIHRLLRPLSKTSHSFYHDAQRPLPLDVVVVDEASMVDLAVMSKLAQAVPRNARLILIGDQDQLASVEPGSVFGDICRACSAVGYSKAWQTRLDSFMQKLFTADDFEPAPISSLGDCIVNLDRNFRFEENSDIQVLCQMIRRGDGQELVQIFNNPGQPNIQFQEIDPDKDWLENLEKKILAGYGEYLQTSDPQSALKKFNRFKILCAIKKGPFGTEDVNQRAERILYKAGLIRPHIPWYRGRPILITKNDYSLGLFNGDIGIIWNETESAGQRLLACFYTQSGQIRHFLPDRLPEHETAYALTVHKSQGSEFESVIFLLPDHESPVITRELLYTGISRARNQVAVWGVKKLMDVALSRTIRRDSGLRDMLGNSKGESSCEKR